MNIDNLLEEKQKDILEVITVFDTINMVCSCRNHKRGVGACPGDLCPDTDVITRCKHRNI